jgi:diguanylate cyclase (GGDEF)-like protein
MRVGTAGRRKRQLWQRERLLAYGIALLSVVLTLVVFVVDLLTPLGLAIPGLYAAIVLLSSFAHVRHLSYTIAALASILIVAGQIRTPLDSLPAAVTNANLLLFLLYVWVTAYAVSRIERGRRLLQERDAALARLVREDALTGVSNRRGFEERFTAEYQRAMRARSALSLFMVDIDFFKRYNDAYGHQAGDRCLRAVAGAIGAGLRRPSDFVARYGGEEFVVLLPDTGARGARLQAETIRAAVERLTLPHPGSPHGYVTISVGVATATPRPGGAAPELLRAADRALYRAKRNGRNRIQLATGAGKPRRRARLTAK